MITDLDSAARALHNEVPLCDKALYLRMGECSLRLRSNSAQLLGVLRTYFAHVLSTAVTPDIEVIAIERAAPDLCVDFIVW